MWNEWYELPEDTRAALARECRGESRAAWELFADERNGSSYAAVC